MLNIDLVYYGGDDHLNTDLDCEYKEMVSQYKEMQKIIENDFTRFLDYKVNDYDNNERLVELLRFVKDNVCNIRSYDDSIENAIIVTNDFLSFDYIVYDYELDFMVSNTMVVKRDYKEFYFIFDQDNYEDLNLWRFLINHGKVEEEHFHNVHTKWNSESSILESIDTLSKEIKVKKINRGVV